MIVEVRQRVMVCLLSPAVLALLLCTLAAPGAAAQGDVITIKNDNVGIGETDPQYRLHIVDDSGSNGQADVLLALENNGPPRIDQTDTNNNVTFRQTVGLAGTKRFYRVIDMGDPTEVELELNGDGDLVITGALTTAADTYPDYVFDDSYRLMPLSELASYIDVHGHLPNVPSAEETDGGRSIDMSELQVRLLEKVEELTLYTLQQERRIEELERRLAGRGEVEGEG